MKAQWVVLLVVLGLTILFPAAVEADSAAGPITFAFQEKNGHFDIQARFRIKATPQVVWETLTDFESYPKFSHELKKVQVTERSENHMTVEEMAESGFLFFTQKVFFTLDVHVVPGVSVTTEDTGHKSFVSYRTDWALQPDESGVELDYHLRAEGHFGGPAFAVNDAFSGGVRNFLQNMQKEMLRREALKEKETQGAIPAAASPAPSNPQK